MEKKEKLGYVEAKQLNGKMSECFKEKTFYSQFKALRKSIKLSSQSEMENVLESE